MRVLTAGIIEEGRLAAYLCLTLAVIYTVHRILQPKSKHKPRRGQTDDFPPGIRSVLSGLRILRHFLLTNDINRLPDKKYYEQKFGKTMGLCGLSKRGVIISDVKVLKEAFTNPAIYARVPLDFLQMYQDGKFRGIVINSGEPWQELRRFTVTQFKNYGVGHRTLCPTIMREVEETIIELRKNLGTPFMPNYFFGLPAFNILWQIISSQRMSHKDPEASYLIESISETFGTPILLICMHLMPKLTNFVLWLFDANPIPDGHRRCLKLFGSLVEERRVGYTKNQRKDDLVDKFLEKIESTTDPNSQFYGQLGYENLAETIRDLFVAGSQSTSATVSFHLLYLALHPEKQKKLQNEIDRVLCGKPPTLFDRANMLYTEAVISETLRRSSHTPMGIMHVATEDTTLGQYKLPKDTVVMGNVYAIHHCKETWTDPYEFRPERFLNDDESALVKHEAFIPFGVGKRKCPGENLARDELFLFLTSMMQQFDVAWNPQEKKPDMGCTYGISLFPKPYTIIFTARKREAYGL